MSDFEQNDPFGLQRFVEKDQGKIQEQQMERKKSPYLPRVLLLVFAAVVVISIVYFFWPSVKGNRLTEKASALLNGDVSLTGIIYAEENPMAIVNSEIVHEGDAVGDVKVVKIHKNGVELERAGRRWSQSMPATGEGVHSGSSGL